MFLVSLFLSFSFISRNDDQFLVDHVCLKYIHTKEKFLKKQNLLVACIKSSGREYFEKSISYKKSNPKRMDS